MAKYTVASPATQEYVFGDGALPKISVVPQFSVSDKASLRAIEAEVGYIGILLDRNEAARSEMTKVIDRPESLVLARRGRTDLEVEPVCGVQYNSDAVTLPFVSLNVGKVSTAPPQALQFTKGVREYILGDTGGFGPTQQMWDHWTEQFPGLTPLADWEANWSSDPWPSYQDIEARYLPLATESHTVVVISYVVRLTSTSFYTVHHRMCALPREGSLKNVKVIVMMKPFPLSQAPGIPTLVYLDREGIALANRGLGNWRPTWNLDKAGAGGVILPGVNYGSVILPKSEPEIYGNAQCYSGSVAIGPQWCDWVRFPKRKDGTLTIAGATMALSGTVLASLAGPEVTPTQLAELTARDLVYYRLPATRTSDTSLEKLSVWAGLDEEGREQLRNTMVGPPDNREALHVVAKRAHGRKYSELIFLHLPDPDPRRSVTASGTVDAQGKPSITYVQTYLNTPATREEWEEAYFDGYGISQVAPAGGQKWTSSQLYAFLNGSDEQEEIAKAKSIVGSSMKTESDAAKGLMLARETWSDDDWRWMEIMQFGWSRETLLDAARASFSGHMMLNARLNITRVSDLDRE